MRFFLTAAFALLLATTAAAQAPSTITQIVFLGTGNPAPDPDAMGPSIAIIVRGTPYLIDAGTGVVRRAAAASKAGVKGLAMPQLSRVFITHLHSDHTIGLPDLMETPWIMRRTDPLQVYGPPGIAAMVTHLMQAFSADNDIRINGLEHGNKTGNVAVAHETSAPGVVYRDSNVKVTAFLVHHGSWKTALGYRFDTPDRSIVLSGDEAPSPSTIAACNGCDVLVHEAYTEAGYAASDSGWKAYSRNFHTSTTELAALARKARPKTLILFHQMYFGRPNDTEAGMLKEIRALYSGRVLSAHDLMVF